MEVLRCPGCGSRDLTQVGNREFKCEHCNTPLILSADESMLTLLGRRCPECDLLNDAAARFCGECGARLTQECADCEAHVSLGLSFCPCCGHDLSEDSSSEDRSQEILREAQRRMQEAVERTKRAAREAERQRDDRP